MVELSADTIDSVCFVYPFLSASLPMNVTLQNRSDRVSSWLRLCYIFMLVSVSYKLFHLVRSAFGIYSISRDICS